MFNKDLALLELIKLDKLEELTTLLTKYGSYREKISLKNSDVDTMLKNNPYPLFISAFYGSRECFNFLYANESGTELVDDVYCVFMLVFYFRFSNRNPFCSCIKVIRVFFLYCWNGC